MSRTIGDWFEEWGLSAARAGEEALDGTATSPWRRATRHEQTAQHGDAHPRHEMAGLLEDYARDTRAGG